MVIGGSADLTPSNKTWFEGAENFSKDNRKGRYIRYGVREHAMGAIMNGISVSGMLRSYGGTFLVFSDYMRGALRVAALSGYPSIFVFTHDSIGVGEDGPTHQPVEHAASLRAIPGLHTFRPADANETAQAWKYALENKNAPSALLLTRQGLPVLDQNKYTSAENLSKGAYPLVKQENPDVIIMASGSEVSVALCAGEGLEKEGIKAQIVSMPCWSLFQEQSAEYKESVIPSTVKARVAVEAGVRLGWDKWIGSYGEFVGIETFGISGPANEVFEKFGINAENVIKSAQKSIKTAKNS
jgi:transketolase